MADLSVDTESIIDVATSIKRINKDINNQFVSVQKAMNSLNTEWDGEAAEHAVKKFNEVKTIVTEDRSEVISDLISMLTNVVGIGYSEIESTNKKLADAFK